MVPTVYGLDDILNEKNDEHGYNSEWFTWI